MLNKLLAEGFGMLEKNVFSNITGGAGGFNNFIGSINNGGFGNMFNNILKW